jgi:hypothetical protein
MIGLNKTCKSLILFIDEFNQTFINKSYEVCGGSSDQYKACIFDYLATGDTSFAADTQSTNKEAESETSKLGKEIFLCIRLLQVLFRVYCMYIINTFLCIVTKHHI